MGRLFACGDAGALAAALDEVLAAPAQFHKPHEHIATTFALANTIDAYEAVLVAKP
jgi:hypothetical protein